MPIYISNDYFFKTPPTFQHHYYKQYNELRRTISPALILKSPAGTQTPPQR